MILNNMNFMNCIRCPAKDSIIHDHNEGEIVCNKCGEVYQENTTADSTINSEFNKKPENYLELGTFLEIKEKDDTKKIIKEYKNRTKIDKNFKKIEKVLSLAQVPSNLIETTKTLYKTLAPNKNLQGRSFTHIIIALYFYALRIENNAKSLKEIIKSFPGVTEREIRKAYNSIKCYVVKNDDEDELYSIEKNYIQLYLGVNEENYSLKILSYKIIKNINMNYLLEGKSPNTIAGLGLLLANKVIGNNYDNEKKNFFKIFSNKNAILKAFEEIKEHLYSIIPVEYWEKVEELKGIKI